MRDCLLALWLLCAVVLSQELAVQQTDIPRSASDLLANFDVAAYLQKMHAVNPARYRFLMEQERQMRSLSRPGVLQQQFWALNLEDPSDPQFYQIQATLRLSSGDLRIWVEDDSWNAGYVTATEVQALGERLLNSTPAASIDPSRGIVEIDTMLFGQPPDRNADGLLNFLLLNIPDGYNPENGNRGFIAGYFFPLDQSGESMSNRMDILYLDTFPGILSPVSQQLRTTIVLGTSAHELQHLIHFNYDRTEDTWLNESMSELATLVCGYGSTAELYLSDPNRSLDIWQGELRDYSRVGLWGAYLFEQFGPAFIGLLLRDSRNGITSLSALLPGEGRSLPQTYNDWIVANLLNDRSAGVRYGYQHPDLRGLSAAISADITQFPQLTSLELEAYAATYFRLRGSGTLEIAFSAALQGASLLRRSAAGLEILPVSGDSLSYSAFNADDQFYLVFGGTSVQLFSACVYAPFSIASAADVYDDGSIDLRLTGGRIIANRFTVPPGGFELLEVQYQHTDPGDIRLHYWRDGGAGPGNAIVSPRDTMLQTGDALLRIAPPRAVIAALTAGETFYVGVEALTADVPFAYDDNRLNNQRSWLWRNSSEGWRRLADFEVNNRSLSGNWLIRAFYSGGELPSGSKSCAALVNRNAGPLRLEASFPNPARNSFNVRTDVSGAGEWTMRLYNLLGEVVATYQQRFNGIGKVIRVNWERVQSDNGNRLANGVYFLRATFLREDGRREVSNTLKIIILDY